MQIATAERTTIDRDREFDQTAKTEPPRTVSPAILEQRIIRLKRELDIANADRRDVYQRLRVANGRIAGFENLCRSVSEKLDEMDAAFKKLSGTTPAEAVTA